jgi:hypothetical protein
MDGAMLGGLMAVGLAVVALGATVALGAPADAEATTVRVIGLAFIAGIAILGIVAIILAWTLESAVPVPLGLALGFVVGLSAIGMFAVLRNARPGPEGRARTIVLLALVEGVGVVAWCALTFAMFLVEPT